MRNKGFLCTLLLAASLILVLPPAARAADPPADWAWLLDQAASGAGVIRLPNSIVFEGDTGINAGENQLRIEGNGHSITGAVVDGGTVVFRDVLLYGTQGINDEDGAAALTLRGEGTIAVLLGATRAEAGMSGKQGEQGGHGVWMQDNRQGLILNQNAMALGATGRIFGGSGVRVDGCDSNILLTDNASISGSMGLAEGGMGIRTPACCKITLSGQSAASGGNAQNTAGNGVTSLICGQCEGRGLVTAGDMSMIIGAIGQTGGHAILLERPAQAEEADLVLSGSCMLIGGDGAVSGSALVASHVIIDYQGAIQAVGGRYFTTDTPTLQLEGCNELGDKDALTIVEGAQASQYPASNMSSMINAALSHRSARDVPVAVENGLNVRAIETKMNGVTVERGMTSQAKISGGGLKIFMHGGTMEKRLQFQQRLMTDGADGIRLVLISAVSDEWPTIDTSIAALGKLQSLGVTQLAYTCVHPAYNERVLDLQTLQSTAEAYQTEHGVELSRILCGTADDAIIFVLPNGTWDYQEELMDEVIRPIG